MRYVRWVEATCEGLEGLGITELITEVDEDGEVTREVGLDIDGHVVHRSPSSTAPHAIFEMALISSGEEDERELTRADFERLWQSAGHESTPPSTS